MIYALTGAYRCSPVPMFHSPFVHQSLCFPFPVFTDPIFTSPFIPQSLSSPTRYALCLPVSILPSSFAPKSLCSPTLSSPVLICPRSGFPSLCSSNSFPSPYAPLFCHRNYVYWRHGAKCQLYYQSALISTRALRKKVFVLILCFPPQNNIWLKSQVWMETEHHT